MWGQQESAAEGAFSKFYRNIISTYVNSSDIFLGIYCVLKKRIFSCVSITDLVLRIALATIIRSVDRCYQHDDRSIDTLIARLWLYQTSPETTKHIDIKWPSSGNVKFASLWQLFGANIDPYLKRSWQCQSLRMGACFALVLLARRHYSFP